VSGCAMSFCSFDRWDPEFLLSRLVGVVLMFVVFCLFCLDGFLDGLLCTKMG